MKNKKKTHNFNKKRKTNLALDAVFSENELNELLDTEELQEDRGKSSTFEG